ncbi:hypothetical protein FT663_01394 [Candidozyma haemuli var. vulneris]|uniref:Glycerol-1-phosphatase n=1 Tax=Candidozyma haemuli TaxID=45357 RepID=A0A2V1AZ77_9ASCO|nr:hypothetical protein CXQ85_002765 [[Candida] haemuloni]KAF3992529.1 hypothetical protein FT662_01075 [[Candida] haemuloni var. vulneris]KAF3994481.1 hypothetical protein FT663_01394 [[Candida] haemuloni var. vulneris]PVH23039.1 hypothetical protein CXQ85_002765 [[Candida] haemuloni]
MQTISTNYILFDLDGTLVNTTDAVETAWQEVLDEHNSKHEDQIETSAFLATSHGRRTIETYQRWFPYKDTSDEAIGAYELSIATKYGHLAKEVPGSTVALTKLNEQSPQRWAICTSGTTDLAHGWVDNVFEGLKKPEVFVTANDVSEGKPHPEGYLKAAQALAEVHGKPGKSVVFEDAPMGARAGVNAGYTVIGLATTFSKEILEEAGATYVVKDFTKVGFELKEDGIDVKLETI